MNIINLERGAGKTTILLMTANVTNIPIITHSNSSKNILKSIAEKEGYDISVYTANEYSELKKSLDEKVLVDNAEFLIEEALRKYLGADIEAITMSVPMVKKEKE